MANMVMLDWAGVTTQQYGEVRAKVGWLENAPEGGMMHVAAFEGDRCRITDVWESPEAFQRFVDERLMPAVQEVGITSEPNVEVLELHELFEPVHRTITR